MQLEHAEDRAFLGSDGGRKLEAVPFRRDKRVEEAVVQEVLDEDYTPVEGMPSHIEPFVEVPEQRGLLFTAIALISLSVVAIALALVLAS